MSPVVAPRHRARISFASIQKSREWDCCRSDMNWDQWECWTFLQDFESDDGFSFHKRNPVKII